MKKFFIVVALLFAFPVFVNASTLATGINVDGIGDLGLDRNTYNLTLTTTLDYAEITVSKTSDNVTVEGDGRVNVSEGDNQLLVKLTDGVTAEDYTINLKVVRPGENDSGSPETGAFVSLIVIVVALVVAVCLIIISKKKSIFKL